NDLARFARRAYSYAKFLVVGAGKFLGHCGIRSRWWRVSYDGQKVEQSTSNKNVPVLRIRFAAVPSEGCGDPVSIRRLRRWWVRGSFVRRGYRRSRGGREPGGG